MDAAPATDAGRHRSVQSVRQFRGNGLNISNRKPSRKSSNAARDVEADTTG
jgi:hypothetical protein